MATIAIRIRTAADGRMSAAMDLAILIAFFALIQVGAILVLAWSWTPPDLLRLSAAPIQMLLLLLLSTVLMARRRLSWRSVGLARPKSVIRVFVLVLVGYIGALSFNAAFVLLISHAPGAPLPKLGVLTGLQSNLWRYLGLLVVVWSSAAVGEEMLFRGFIWSRLEMLFGGGRSAPIPALIAQSVLFGLAHAYQGFGGMVATALVGTVLGAVFLASRRNLIAGMILHGVVDTVSLTIIFILGVPIALAR